MKFLYLIPARGGSKGLPNKNILPLNGKPLLTYSIDAALAVSDKSDICISTDSETIKQVVEDYGLPVPFLRPEEIAHDHATSEQVMLHALDFYQQQGKTYDYLVMLQPTSPLRDGTCLQNALDILEPEMELLVSVKETDANPYYVLFSEEENGKLKKVKEATFTRRQDCPTIYELNGAIYIIKVAALLEKGYQALQMNKFLMDKKISVDIDDEIDFKLAGLLLKEQTRS